MRVVFLPFQLSPAGLKVAITRFNQACLRLDAGSLALQFGPASRCTSFQKRPVRCRLGCVLSHYSTSSRLNFSHVLRAAPMIFGSFRCVASRSQRSARNAASGSSSSTRTIMGAHMRMRRRRSTSAECASWTDTGLLIGCHVFLNQVANNSRKMHFVVSLNSSQSSESCKMFAFRCVEIDENGRIIWPAESFVSCTFYFAPKGRFSIMHWFFLSFLSFLGRFPDNRRHRTGDGRHPVLQT